MLIGRSIQGIGGGGILTLGDILITDLVPLAVRGAWFGYLGSMWALGSVTGPLLGGGLAENVSWRCGCLGRTPFLLWIVRTGSRDIFTLILETC